MSWIRRLNVLVRRRLKKLLLQNLNLILVRKKIKFFQTVPIPRILKFDNDLFGYMVQVIGVTDGDRDWET